MNGRSVLRCVVSAVLSTMLVLPNLTRAQSAGDGGTPFSQQELDQVLAPIALYPDSLLAQVLVAATYPIEVVQADRWVRKNKSLKGDELNAALDNQNWDLSVKALVPFPQVLAMMSDKLDWTQKLGDAFLAQQSEVMATVQKLRNKARSQGNLTTNSQQKVIVQDQVVVIEPASPQVVYVPYYNPTVVYGPWWYPAYPPYYWYHPGAVFAAGAIGFAAGIAVGSAWNWGWGHWDWNHNNINVNVNRNVNINNTNIHANDIHTQSWQHDVAHRQGAPYREGVAGQRYGQGNMGSPDGRRDYRGYQHDGQGDRHQGQDRQGAGDRQEGRTPDRSGLGAGGRPTADDAMRGLQQHEGEHAFSNFGRGSDARTQSDRGFSSRGGSSGERDFGERGAHESHGGGGGGFHSGGGFGGGGHGGGGSHGGGRR